MNDIDQLKLKTMLRDLSTSISKSRWTVALKICVKVLKLVPNNEEALHSRILIEIHLNNYASALYACQEFKKKKFKDLIFEEAYIYYRMGKFQECIQGLVNCSAEREKALLAQAYFRADEYRNAVSIYDNLLESTASRTKAHEMYSNAIAACGLWLLQEGSSVKMQVEKFLSKHENAGNHSQDLGYFETLFNRSFVFFALRDYDTCEKLILSALELCTDDVHSEKLMKLQLAYVYHCKGNSHRAHDILQSISSIDGKTVSHSIYMINNYSNQPNPPLLQTANWGQGEKDKAPAHQRIPLCITKAIEEVRCGTQMPSSVDTSISLVELIYLVKIDKTKAQQRANELLKSTCGDLFTTLYALNILYENTTSFSKFALSHLEKFVVGSISQYPGLIVLVCHLITNSFNQNDAYETISRLLDDILKQDLYTPLKVYVLQVKAEFLVSVCKDFEKAATVLSEAVKLDSKNDVLFIKFISVVSRFDTGQAEETLRLLPGISQFEDQVRNLDTTSIERHEEMSSQRRARKVKMDKSIEMKALEKARRALKRKEKKKKQMLKRKILLKSYHPEISPDPERWIPKWQRAAYQKAMNRRKKKLKTQGVEDGGEKITELRVEKVAESSKIAGRGRRRGLKW